MYTAVEELVGHSGSRIQSPWFMFEGMSNAIISKVQYHSSAYHPESKASIPVWFNRRKDYDWE